MDKARLEAQNIIDDYDRIFKKLDDQMAEAKEDPNLSELERDTKLMVLRAVKRLANGQGANELLKWKERNL